jgi:hypothetical protein
MYHIEGGSRGSISQDICKNNDKMALLVLVSTIRLRESLQGKTRNDITKAEIIVIKANKNGMGK